MSQSGSLLSHSQSTAVSRDGPFIEVNILSPEGSVVSSVCRAFNPSVHCNGDRVWVGTDEKCNIRFKGRVNNIVESWNNRIVMNNSTTLLDANQPFQVTTNDATLSFGQLGMSGFSLLIGYDKSSGCCIFVNTNNPNRHSNWAVVKNSGHGYDMDKPPLRHDMSTDPRKYYPLFSGDTAEFRPSGMPYNNMAMIRIVVYNTPMSSESRTDTAGINIFPKFNVFGPNNASQIINVDHNNRPPTGQLSWKGSRNRRGGNGGFSTGMSNAAVGSGGLKKGKSGDDEGVTALSQSLSQVSVSKDDGLRLFRQNVKNPMNEERVKKGELPKSTQEYMIDIVNQKNEEGGEGVISLNLDAPPIPCPFNKPGSDPIKELIQIKGGGGKFM